MVDDKAAFPDWNNRADIQAELRVALIMLLSKNGYPPVTYAEVYKEVFDQAEHFKAHRTVWAIREKNWYDSPTF